MKDACKEQGQYQMLQEVLYDHASQGNQQEAGFLVQALSKEERLAILPEVLTNFEEQGNKTAFSLAMDACLSTEKSDVETMTNNILEQREANRANVSQGQGTRGQGREQLPPPAQAQVQDGAQEWQIDMVAPLNAAAAQQRMRQQQRNQNQQRSRSTGRRNVFRAGMPFRPGASYRRMPLASRFSLGRAPL